MEKEQIIEWLRAQDYLILSDLRKSLNRQYDLVFDILQSYYIVILIKIGTKIEYNKIKSTRHYFERQTYYGAYYSQTKEFIVQELKKRTAIASENFPRDQKYYLLPEKSQFKKGNFIRKL